VPNISTSSSKRKLPHGFICMIFFIVMIEAGLSLAYQFNADFYGGERVSWRRVKFIQTKEFDMDKPIILLGDSTVAMLGTRLEKHGVLNFSTNYLATMAGHYYLLRDYLKAGGNPERVFLVTLEKTWPNDIRYKEDRYKGHRYFFRPFASLANILELGFELGRWDLAATMLWEGILPSKRFKSVFVQFMKQYSIYTLKFKNRWAEGISSRTKEENIYRSIFKDPMTISEFSKFYFKKIIKLCKANSIPFRFIESYIPESRMKAEAGKNYYDGWRRFLDEQGVDYKLRVFSYPDEAFNRDGYHIKGEERMRFIKDLVHEINS